MIKQNIAGKSFEHKHLMVFIAFLGAFIPLSIDLYLPALPGMAAYFNAPVSRVNLTLIMFFIFFAMGNLLWGPLSDRFGRRSILRTGLLIYIVASILCALSGTVIQLIVFRSLQAVGGGAATSVATAMIKDLWSGRKRESVLAIVQTMVIIAPVIAPVMGALLLRFTSWRGIFWTLSALGAAALVMSMALRDTLGKRYSGTFLQTMGRLGVVLKNPGFAWLLIIFSPTVLPMMAFIASSSFVYVDGFNLTEQAYSYYFSVNALCAMCGPFLYIALSARIRRRFIIIACFATIAASGCLICTLGGTVPWLFALSVIPATIAGSALRPPGTNLMLQQQTEDIGSASSLISFCAIMMGSIGMLLISLDWRNVIWVLGILNLAAGLVSGVLWLAFSQKSFIKGI